MRSMGNPKSVPPATGRETGATPAGRVTVTWADLGRRVGELAEACAAVVQAAGEARARGAGR